MEYFANLLEIILVLIIGILPLLIPAWLFAKKKWHFAGIWLLIYLGVYGVLSFNGQYLGGNFGGNDNRDTWFAKFCGRNYSKPSGRTGIETTYVGIFFWPAAFIDGLFWHRTNYDPKD